MEKLLQKHEDNIAKTLISNSVPISFDSAVSSDIFENPSRLILFEITLLISNDFGMKQVFQEAIEIKLVLNNNASLNRNLREYSLNAL